MLAKNPGVIDESLVGIVPAPRVPLLQISVSRNVSFLRGNLLGKGVWRVIQVDCIIIKR